LEPPSCPAEAIGNAPNRHFHRPSAKFPCGNAAAVGISIPPWCARPDARESGGSPPVTNEVSLRQEGEVAVITVDNPPVNALKQAVRAGLLRTLTQARDDVATRAIVLVGAGRTFIAGADITEFGKPPQPPSPPEIIALIENAPKPVIAAMHGTP